MDREEASRLTGLWTVEFFVDGVSMGVDSSAPYTWSVNTNNLANGQHVYNVTSTSSGGSKSYSQITVTYNNQPISVSITSPANGATVSASDGNILLVLQSSEATFMAVGVTLAGNLRADATSSLAILMGTGATLTGMIERGSLEMVGDCTWTVTANSVLTELIDDAGIVGSHVTNIIGNGHNVHYDANLPANDYLGGYSYILVNGGLLTPGTVAGQEKRTWGSVKTEYR